VTKSFASNSNSARKSSCGFVRRVKIRSKQKSKNIIKERKGGTRRINKSKRQKRVRKENNEKKRVKKKTGILLIIN
jgi:hypothetical protein